MTSSIPRQVVRVRPHDPPTDRRLAAIHLRMGQLGLARAELEALAGSGDLDTDALVALAEARWRTGDLTGAGEAAQAYLATGGDDLVAIVIAAEATAAVGRPSEARRLAGRALERSDMPLDHIFAGIRRSTIWPVDTTHAPAPEAPVVAPDSPTEVVTTAVAPEEAPIEPAPEALQAEVESTERELEGGLRASAGGASAGQASAGVQAVAATDGFWDVETIRGDGMPEPQDQLTTATSDLANGDRAAAAVHLAVALRIAPDRAGDVLDLVDGIPDRDPELELVRGDALRLVGREDDARRAYADASAAIVRRQAAGERSPEPRSEPIGVEEGS
jgi:hypothetical protein